MQIWRVLAQARNRVRIGVSVAREGGGRRFPVEPAICHREAAEFPESLRSGDLSHARVYRNHLSSYRVWRAGPEIHRDCKPADRFIATR